MALFENLIKDAGKGEKKAAGFAVTIHKADSVRK